MSRVLIGATNYGSWAEEVQAPWDALTKAGHEVTLATPRGLKPLPLAVSVDQDFVDPIQNVKVNPPEVCERARELVAGQDWASPVPFGQASMDSFDALVLTGGPGATIDIANHPDVHRLILEAQEADKLIGAICYAVGALVFARDPKTNASVVRGKTITAHPRAWDFKADLSYDLYQPTADNEGTNVVTPGFLFPLQDLAIDAVGPDGTVSSSPETSRERPDVQFDWPFVTACSVESSVAYGEKLLYVLRTHMSG
jgi:putative intracellular protease/amidase